jgi:release factor glutamine methyltransferase
LYLEAKNRLRITEDEETAGLMARNLLCYATGERYETLLARGQSKVSDKAYDTMQRALYRVQTGEPLAYIIGEWDFYGMTLQVTKDVLIPRDDTCAVVGLAINQALYLNESPRILDLCTGSGCIGLAIATRVKDARVTLADVSREAIAVARRNISSQKLSSRVSCVSVDALQEPPAFLGKFDMIVSNPPYITTEEMQQLPKSVKDFEPELALHGGEDGLVFYRAIAENYYNVIKPGGYLCFEFGMGQGDDVCRILETNGYTILERTRDYNDIERAVIAQTARKEF